MELNSSPLGSRLHLVACLTRRMWQKCCSGTSKAVPENTLWLPARCIGILAVGALGHHIRSLTTLRPPCWMKEAQANHEKRPCAEWDAWQSLSIGSHSSEGPRYWGAEMSHFPSPTPRPCPNCRFMGKINHCYCFRTLSMFRVVSYRRIDNHSKYPRPSHYE